MATLSILSSLVSVAAMVACLYAAIVDFRTFTIQNELVAVLAGLYLLHACLAQGWSDMPWDLALAACVFAILLVFYALNALGGGDVKLLPIAFLWAGHSGAFAFAPFLSVCSLVYFASGMMGWVRVLEAEQGREMAFAPSIAAALIATILSGAVQPWPWSIWAGPS